MNGLIPLGIPNSQMIQFITTGLSENFVPPPDPGDDPNLNQIELNRTTLLTTGILYVLPPKTVLVYVSNIFAELYVSNDGIALQAVTIDSNSQFQTAATFLTSNTEGVYVTPEAL